MGRGPREKTQWRLLKEALEKQYNSTLPRGWDGPSYLQREGMELQVWICFVSPKWSLSEVQKKQKKIWENFRSEDIQVHQCWEVFPEVLLPSSEIRSSHVVYIGACCILSPNKLQYQFPWCPHMSSHWSLNFIVTGQRSLSRWSKLSVEILLLPAHLSPWPQRS